MLFVKFITQAKDLCVFFDGQYKKFIGKLSNNVEVYLNSKIPNNTILFFDNKTIRKNKANFILNNNVIEKCGIELVNFRL